MIKKMIACLLLLSVITSQAKAIGITNTAPTPSNSTYENIQDTSIEFNDDDTFTITVNVNINFPGGGQERVKTWIDLNGDGLLEESEKVMDISLQAVGYSTMVFSTTVSTSLITADGEVTYLGMRSSLAFYDQPLITGWWCYGDTTDVYFSNVNTKCKCVKVCGFYIEDMTGASPDESNPATTWKDKAEWSLHRANDIMYNNNAKICFEWCSLTELDPLTTFIDGETLANFLDDNGGLRAGRRLLAGGDYASYVIDDQGNKYDGLWDPNTQAFNEDISIQDLLGQLKAKLKEICPDEEGCEKLNIILFPSMASETPFAGTSSWSDVANPNRPNHVSCANLTDDECGATFVHELIHTLGGRHVTGPENANNVMNGNNSGTTYSNYSQTQDWDWQQSDAAYTYICDNNICHTLQDKCESVPAYETPRNALGINEEQEVGDLNDLDEYYLPLLKSMTDELTALQTEIDAETDPTAKALLQAEFDALTLEKAETAQEYQDVYDFTEEFWDTANAVIEDAAEIATHGVR